MHRNIVFISFTILCKETFEKEHILHSNILLIALKKLGYGRPGLIRRQFQLSLREQLTLREGDSKPYSQSNVFT
jgi:hypothetical protein